MQATRDQGGQDMKGDDKKLQDIIFYWIRLNCEKEEFNLGRARKGYKSGL